MFLKFCNRTPWPFDKTFIWQSNENYTSFSQTWMASELFKLLVTAPSETARSVDIGIWDLNMFRKFCQKFQLDV